MWAYPLPISKPLFRPFLGRGDDQGGGCPTHREFHGHLDIHTDKDNYPKWNITFLLWANYSPFQNLFFYPFLGRGDDQGGGYPTPVELHEYHEYHEHLERFHLFTNTVMCCSTYMKKGSNLKCPIFTEKGLFIYYVILCVRFKPI